MHLWCTHLVQILHSIPFWFDFTGLAHSIQGYFHFGLLGMRCTIRGKGNAKRRKKYKIRKKERGATNNDDKWMGQKKTIKKK